MNGIAKNAIGVGYTLAATTAKRSRQWILESRMMRKYPVRFGGGPMETGPSYRAGGLPYLISLQLGGSNSIRNLWPQSFVTQPLNAYVKCGSF